MAEFNYEKFGMFVAIAVTVCLCGFAAIASGENILTEATGMTIPNITSSTSTNNPYPQDGFYDYCYRMGLDC
tara:strand:+ start:1506 stop:1721 length:216 start_codon:yes stop_codon:yes gene_type:complete